MALLAALPVRLAAELYKYISITQYPGCAAQVPTTKPHGPKPIVHIIVLINVQCVCLASMAPPAPLVSPSV